MIDIIKKTLLAGIGAAVITKEKAESALEEFVQQGKVSSQEARAMAEKIAAEGRREFETLSGELGDKLKEFFARQDRETRERLAVLEARVTALENAASRPPPPGPPTA